MRTRMRRWLLHRRKSELKPLCMRAIWPEFAYRMHAAIARDMRLLLDEAAPEDYYERPTAHITQILAWYEQGTLADEQATQPLAMV